MFTCSTPFDDVFTLIMLLMACSLISLLLISMSLLPFTRRINRDMWVFVLERLGKKQRLALAARVLDAWTAWLSFLWGVCLLPVCFGLYWDAFVDIDAPFKVPFAPLMAYLTVFLMVLTFIANTLCAFIRWLYLRGQSPQKEGTLPPLPPTP